MASSSGTVRLSDTSNSRAFYCPEAQAQHSEHSLESRTSVSYAIPTLPDISRPVGGGQVAGNPVESSKEKWIASLKPSLNLRLHLA